MFLKNCFLTTYYKPILITAIFIVDIHNHTASALTKCFLFLFFFRFNFIFLSPFPFLSQVVIQLFLSPSDIVSRVIGRVLRGEDQKMKDFLHQHRKRTEKTRSSRSENKINKSKGTFFSDLRAFRIIEETRTNFNISKVFLFVLFETIKCFDSEIFEENLLIFLFFFLQCEPIFKAHVLNKNSVIFEIFVFSKKHCLVE